MKKPEKDNTLLSTAEVGERLGVSTETVRRLIADRKLKAVRLTARCIRIRHEDLEVMIEQLRS